MVEWFHALDGMDQFQGDTPSRLEHTQASAIGTSSTLRPS
jgi:hypothetical protein